MNATTIAIIKPQEPEPPNGEHRGLPPFIGFLVRGGFFTLIGFGVVLSVVLGLVQKWLWMRKLDYAGIYWTILSVKWGIFAVALVVSVIYLWLTRVIVASSDKVVMEPTLDEVLGSLFGAGPGQSSPLSEKQAGVPVQLSKATRGRAKAQLADAQKAINALKQLLDNPAQ